MILRQSEWVSGKEIYAKLVSPKPVGKFGFSAIRTPKVSLSVPIAAILCPSLI